MSGKLINITFAVEVTFKKLIIIPDGKVGHTILEYPYSDVLPHKVIITRIHVKNGWKSRKSKGSCFGG